MANEESFNDKVKAFRGKIGSTLIDKPREVRATALNKLDDEVDTSQAINKKLENVPLIGRFAKAQKSGLTSDEAGYKVGKFANYLGTGDKGTLAATKLGKRSTEIGIDAASSAKRLASEHGGKIAAATAAGLGALGLVKALRRKKAKTKEISEIPS